MKLGVTAAGVVILLGGLAWLRLRSHKNEKKRSVRHHQKPCGAPKPIRALLIPLTDTARTASFEKNIPIRQYPFRLGRESRLHIEDGYQATIERGRERAHPNNDMYLQDTTAMVQISREHIQIELRADGGFELVDRGSTCGTRVGARAISGGGRCRLKHGDVITLGIKSSPYMFRFVVQD